MKIQSIYYDNIGVARIILESDSGNEYDIAIDNPRRIAWCSCPFYVFNKIPCKHILFAMNYLEYDKMVDKTKSLKHLTTGCKTIDNLLGGGIPYGIVTAVFGEPTTGKTLFGYQSGLSNLANSNKDTILIETEGLRDIDTYNILEKFRSRWNLSSADITKRFKIIHTLGDPKLQSIQKLFQMFGYMITLEISKNGKYSIQFQNTIPTLTPNQLEKTSMIILDSLTKPVKDSVGSETQNLPARAQMTERLFGKLYHVAKIYNIAILVIHHACHDEKTLTLEKNKGLVDYNNIEIGDYVLALDKNGKTVWSKVLDKYVYPYEGLMCQIKGKSIDQLVTPNHRVLYNYKYNGRYEGIKIREASYIPKSGLSIPKSSQIEDNLPENKLEYLSEKYPLEFLEGWYLAEGYLDKKELKGSRWGCRFCLNKNDLKWVENALKKLNIPYCKSKEKNGEIQLGVYRKTFYKMMEKFGRLSSGKYIPDDVIDSYSDLQLKALLFGYLLGDGRNTYGTSWSFTTTSKKLMESLIKLCSKIGYSVTHSKEVRPIKRLKRLKKQFSKFYTGYIRTANKGWAYKKEIYYKGFVWCLSTEHGNFIVSRNGRISFSGNSVNPAMPYGRDLGKPYGGSPVLYNSKYAIGFVDATSEIKKNTGWGIEARRVRLLRRPDEQTTGQLYPVRLKKDWGFDDS